MQSHSLATIGIVKIKIAQLERNVYDVLKAETFGITSLTWFCTVHVGI